MPASRSPHLGSSIAVVAMLLFLNVCAVAQARVEAFFDTSVVETGDPFVLHFRVSDSGLRPDTLDLRDLYRHVPDSNVLGRSGWYRQGEVWLNDLTLIAFDSAQIGPLAGLAVVSGPDTLPLSGEPPSIGVLPTPAPTDLNDMADIKDIRREPRWWLDFAWVLWLLGGLGVVALLGWWLSRFFQKKKKPAYERSLRATARDVALKKLQDLDNQHLWQAGQVKPYYAALSLIAREYLQHTHGVGLLDKTTDEVATLLPALESASATDLIELLRWADLVKFAKATPDVAYHPKALDVVRRVVN
jgi:hypothetical protein